MGVFVAPIHRLWHDQRRAARAIRPAAKYPLAIQLCGALFRQDAKRFCRALQSVEIDGRLTYTSRILGPDFSLTLELFKREG